MDNIVHFTQAVWAMRYVIAFVAIVVTWCVLVDRADRRARAIRRRGESLEPGRQTAPRPARSGSHAPANASELGSRQA